MSKNNFKGCDILSVEQFSKSDLNYLFAVAKKMETAVERGKTSDILRGKIMTALFYEPSSRTFGSFVAAMQRLGGGIIPLQGMTYSSVAKGESLPDTVRTFECYSDVIVIRHPEVGSAKIAAEAAQVPVINAGDGVGEHPTQALLDLFTITNSLGKVDGLEVVMVGDLLNGRTVHSLSKILAKMDDVKLTFVSPRLLKLPQEIKEYLLDKKIKIKETESLEEAVKTADVVYMTRVQKERFTDLKEYEKVKDAYIMTPQVLSRAKKKMLVMHPLPRVGEITTDVDSDPRAVYLSKQMRSGLYTRMALLAAVLGKA